MFDLAYRPAPGNTRAADDPMEKEQVSSITLNLAVSPELHVTDSVANQFCVFFYFI